MHPEREQWGIDIIEGRKEMYPNLDFSSLEALVEVQNSGKSGVSEYDFYWWTKEDIPKVKKVSAYVSAAAGDSFWTVSVVIDHNDLSAPMADGFRSLVLVFGLSSIYFILLSGYITKLLMMELPETSDAYDSAKEIYEASEKAKDVIRQISPEMQLS